MQQDNVTCTSSTLITGERDDLCNNGMADFVITDHNQLAKNGNINSQTHITDFTKDETKRRQIIEEFEKKCEFPQINPPWRKAEGCPPRF